MSRSIAWTVVLVFLAMTTSALAQPQEAPQTGAGAEPAPLAEVPPLAPEAVWRDARILWIASQLQLTAQQAAEVVKALAPGLQQAAACRAARQQLWQEGAAAIHTAVSAWLAGQEPDAATLARLEQVEISNEAQRRAEAAALDRALEAVLALLDATQTSMVESAQDEQAREAAELAYEGAPSLADYIVRQIRAQRYLMPDEYALVRVAEADRVAQRMAGPDGQDLPQIRAAVLRLFDQISQWDDARFSQELPGLADKIRAYLQLTTDASPRPIRHQDFRNWAADPRTSQYLTIYGTAAQPLPPPEPTPPEDLLTALDIVRHVRLLHEFRLDLQQLGQLRTVVSRAQTQAATVASTKAAALATAAPQLLTVIPYLISGQPLSPEWKQWFYGLEEQLRQQDRALDRELISHIAAVGRILDNAQASLVDWRVPPVVAAAAPDTDLAKDMKHDASLIYDTIQLVEGLRPLIQPLYLQLRINRIEQFLSQFIPPAAPEFIQVRDEIGDIITQARGIPQEEWPALAPEVAVRILRAAGQLVSDRWEESNRPVSWWDLRDFLVSPNAAAIVDQMIAGRQG